MIPWSDMKNTEESMWRESFWASD